MGFRDLQLRARTLIAPARVDRDLHEELEFHIECEARKLMDEGMPENRATYLAV